MYTVKFMIFSALLLMSLFITGIIVAMIDNKPSGLVTGLIIVDVMLLIFTFLSIYYGKIEMEEQENGEVHPDALLNCWHCGNPTLARKKHCQHCHKELQ